MENSESGVEVSVIIPVYNTAPYLEDCINSVLNQTFSYYEIIIVNDGSTDNSEEICECIKKRDSRITLISYTDKCGVSHARNVGLRAAHGKYIYFLDSDDMVHPQVLYEAYQQAEETQVDMLTTGLFMPNVNKGQNGETFCEQKFNPQWEILSDKEIWDYWFHMKFSNAIGGKMFLKESIRDQFFDERIGHSEDILYNYIFLCGDHRKVAITLSEGYYYRYREDSASHSMTTKELQSLLIIMRKIRDNELKYGRRENAAIMEKEIVAEIRNSNLDIEDEAKDKQIRTLLKTERHNQLFRELPLKQKLLFNFCYANPSLYSKVRTKIKRFIYAE